MLVAFAATGTAVLQRDSLGRRRAWLEFSLLSRQNSWGFSHRWQTSCFSGCRRTAGGLSRQYRVLHVGASALTQEALAVAGVAALGAAAIAALALAMSKAGDDKPNKDTANAEGASRSGAEDAADNVRAIPTLPVELEEALQEFDGDFRGPWVALGLDPDAAAEVSPEEIKSAYRKAVREEHPDRSELPDAEARFNKVRKAYALLLDEGTRALLLEALSREADSFQELDAGPATGQVMLPYVPAIALAVLLGYGLTSWIRIGAAAGPVRRKTSRSSPASERGTKTGVADGVVPERGIDK